MKSLTFMFFFAASLLTGTGHAATALERLDQVLSGNSQNLETLATSSPELRQAAMEAAAYPEVLWEMDREQKRTSEQFQRLITPYPRKTQEKIYDLVRYPNLVEDLVEGGPKAKDQIKNLSRDLPKGVQEAAKELGTKEYDLLRSIRELNLASDRDFENSLQKVPESSRQAYRKLLGNPEILRALSEDRDLTLALGDAYRANPSQAESRLNDFSAKVAQQNQEALGDYRQTLANDPQAREELQKSAKSFANEYGYDAEDNYYPQPSGWSNFSVNININPYPYWFGYPYWASVPFWRPYPLWYYTGFYGWGSSFYAWGLPSYYYTNWFYGYPRHFYYYPNLASCYGNYYYRTRGRPYYYSGFHRGVNNWYNRNGYRTSDGMWRRDAGSARQWHDYGERQEVRRRQDSPAPAYSQPHWRDRPHHDGKGRPDFVKGTPNDHPRGRDRGRIHNDSPSGHSPGSDSGRYGKRPQNDNSDNGTHGFKPRGARNPQNVSNANNEGPSPSYGTRSRIERSGNGPRNFKPRDGNGNSPSVSDSSNGRRASNPTPVNVIDSPRTVNRSGLTPVSTRGHDSGGSYGFRDSGSSFGSGNSRSSWGGGSSSGFREHSSFGGGSGRSRGGSSFHSGGGGGRGRR